MQTKEIILTIVIGTLISCQSNSDKSELAEFEVPQIINTQFNDSTKSIPYQAEFITEVFPSFVGKFKFQKEIDIYNNAYSLWRVNGCQQGFRSVASFGFGGQESASKPPQAICKPL
jgi:hypothetical protein